MSMSARPPPHYPHPPPPPPSSYSSTQEHRSSSFLTNDPDTSWTSTSSHGLIQHVPPPTTLHVSRPTAEKHPKGRRKRTSAKDKMILEEAYSKNDKPDKQARLEIVKRVDLNEKEVQIWFQNRRQNDRRRSRPLSQQEIQAIAAKQYSARHPIPLETMSALPPCQPQQLPDAAPPRLLDPITSSSSPQSHSISSPLPQSHYPHVQSTPGPANPDMVRRDLPQTTPKHPEPSPSQEPQSAPHSWSSSLLSSSVSSSSSIGYYANRRNLGSSFSTPSSLGRDDSLKYARDPIRISDIIQPDTSNRLESFPPSSCSPKPMYPSDQSQPSSQSSVRLSLSLEGKAELVANSSSPTPNPPPRPSSTPVIPHQRHRQFERSYSDLDDLRLPPLKGFEDARPPRLLRVRSRDVQAWESCADPDTRLELTAQAEHESNGSAIAAINLLRSSSGVLQLNMSKRNAPMPSKNSHMHQAKRAKLSRTTSSLAQLETNMPEKEDQEKESSGKITISRLLSPSDSDKENWSPGDDGRPAEPLRRPTPVDPVAKAPNLGRRRPLQTGMKVPNLLGTRAYTAPARPSSADEGRIEIYEDSPSRPSPGPGEPNVEKFIRGGEVSPSKRPDMDCAAGLLSLARGGWNDRPPSV